MTVILIFVWAVFFPTWFQWFGFYEIDHSVWISVGSHRYMTSVKHAVLNFLFQETSVQALSQTNLKRVEKRSLLFQTKNISLKMGQCWQLTGVTKVTLSDRKMYDNQIYFTPLGKQNKNLPQIILIHLHKWICFLNSLKVNHLKWVKLTTTSTT